jgi:hypothetical protein
VFLGRTLHLPLSLPANRLLVTEAIKIPSPFLEASYQRAKLVISAECHNFLTEQHLCAIQIPTWKEGPLPQAIEHRREPTLTPEFVVSPLESSP